MRIIYLLLVGVTPLFLNAQALNMPDVSPRTQLQQTIGLTHAILDYSRPNVKGRLIFGHLIPYDEVWRTGANEATLIHFDRPVRIGAQRLMAGTYSLYSIPRPGEWTWIINRDTTLWGGRGYRPQQDVVRVEASAKKLTERVETMHLFWKNVTPQQASLTLQWEYTSVSLPVHFFTNQQVEQDIAEHLGIDSPANDYYLAARYFLENDLDLSVAGQWMNTWLEKNGPQFGILRYKALIEHKRGQYEDALVTLRQSLAMAREAGNQHYVRMNEATLQEWQRPMVKGLTAKEALTRSIAYHDPQQRWSGGTFSLPLYESRPGADYRLTELSINNATQTFTLAQQRGTINIYRHLSPDTCYTLLNRKADFTEQEAEQYRLTCSANRNYANYYRYLWGLPMKLTDPGTRLDKPVWEAHFNGQPALQLRVTYDPAVGEDTWYFYLHPETYALLGYQFYHDEAADDGEYIILEDEITMNGVHFPARRYWYTNSDQKFLGKDELLDY